MSDQAQASRQWTIKGVSREDTALVLEAAAARGQTVGQWLAYAVRALPAYERGEQLLPQQRVADAFDGYAREVGQVMNDAQQWADASGLALPKDLTRHAWALLRQRMRRARGLAALKPPAQRSSLGRAVATRAIDETAELPDLRPQIEAPASRD